MAFEYTKGEITVSGRTYVTIEYNSIIGLHDSQWLFSDEQYDDVVKIINCIEEKCKDKSYNTENLLQNSMSGIVNVTESISVFYKLSLEEKADRLISAYENGRIKAEKKCKELLDREDTLNYKEEEEYGNLNRKYALGLPVINNFVKRLDALQAKADKILDSLKSRSKDIFDEFIEINKGLDNNDTKFADNK